MASTFYYQNARVCVPSDAQQQNCSYQTWYCTCPQKILLHFFIFSEVNPVTLKIYFAVSSAHSTKSRILTTSFLCSTKSSNCTTIANFFQLIDSYFNQQIGKKCVVRNLSAPSINTFQKL
jgi:hypothetical protein